LQSESTRLLPRRHQGRAQGRRPASGGATGRLVLMFERTIVYEAAYIGLFPTFEQDMVPAFAWAAEQAVQLDCGVTVVAPSKAHFRDIGLLSELPASVGKETPRTLGRIGRTQPVVVSCWPTARDLDQLDGQPRLKALAVVPWDEDEIGTWRSARHAVDLLGREPAAPAPTITDPVVEAAMTDLTVRVNLSTGLKHPDDRSAAIQAFKILKRNRHEFNEVEIRAWAMSNGWAADDARELGEYAAGVLAGKAYRTGNQQWTSRIIITWRKDAVDRAARRS